jgi:hypothetical protein
MRSAAEHRLMRLMLVACMATGGSTVAASCGPERGGTSTSGPEPVVLDGIFDDWEDAALLADDPRDAPMSPVDLGAIHAKDEPGWLYLSIDMGHEVSAQSLPGTVMILIDADDRRDTGVPRWGLPGVDLVMELSYVADPTSGNRGLGFALRAAGDDGKAVRPYALDLMAAPTSSSRRFELRVARGGSADADLPALHQRVQILTAYVEGGEALDRTAAASYSFTSARTERVADPDLGPAVSTRLTRRSGDVRVAQLNVATRSFTSQPGDFARLLAAVQPDVLLLDELPGDIEHADLGHFFETAPLRALGRWRFVLGITGGRQRAAVATRLDSIRPIPRLLTLRHPDGAVDSLAAQLPETAHAALAREGSQGLSTAGAWIPVGDRELLFVALDLQSGGWAGSLQDRLRVLQASTVRRAVDAELARATPAGDRAASRVAVVLGGDLNLVGSATPLEILSGEAGAQGAALKPVRVRRLGERTEATWRNSREWFGPGRLDFVLASVQALEVPHGFVFATEDLPPELLASLGLEADLSARLSDHLVVVTDLRPR